MILNDNAPAHTAHIVRDHFTRHNVSVMEWPAASPDMNPIEGLWDLLKRQVYKVLPPGCTLDQLFRIAAREWRRIPQFRIHKINVKTSAGTGASEWGTHPLLMDLSTHYDCGMCNL